MILPQYVDDDAVLEDVEREPIRYLPPDGGAWPPVPKWDRRLWAHWLSQHPDWTPDRITQYLDIDRYRYGLGLQRHPKEPFTYFYLPVPAAVPMHASKVPNLCYGGAVGGSKSHSTRFDAYRHLLHIPDYNAILMRRTHEELKRNHTNPALKDCAAINDFFQQDVMDLVPSEHEMRFPLTRGLLTFGHCQNLGDEEKYLGPEYDEFRPDEMATFEKQQIVGVAGRLRSVKHGDYGQVAARLIGTTNPGPSWIKQMFLDKSVPRHENPRYKPDHYQYISARLYDNPYLMDEDGSFTAYEDRLYAYSPQRRKQLLDGNWDAVTGQFFPEWSRDLHIGHADIPAGCKIELCIDWGYSPNPGVCHWVACLPNGRLYVFAEWVFNGEGKPLMVAAAVAARISEITRGIVKETKTKWSRTIGDPSMWAKDGHSGESYEETFRRNGVRMVKADNDRVQGWGRFRHWLQRHPEGGAWLMWSPDCPYAIRTLPTLVHDKNDPDDCNSDSDDHAADCFPGTTLIATEDGERPLSDVVAGDRVWTRDGLRVVRDAFGIGVRPTIRLELSSGRTLTGTANHPIWIEGKGWTDLSCVRYGDMLCPWERASNMWSMAASRSAAIRSPRAWRTSGTTSRVGRGPLAAWKRCIGKSGKTRTDPSRQATTSIIAMATRGITPSIIWSACRRVLTPLSTRARQIWRTWLPFASWRLGGIDLRLAVAGTASNSSEMLFFVNRPPARATSAGGRSPRSRPTADSARAPARQSGATGPGLTMWTVPVPPAAPSSASIGTTRPGSAQRRVPGRARTSGSLASASAVTVDASSARSAQRRGVPVSVVSVQEGPSVQVYNLTVDDVPEYFAEGVLVHNCDRYLVMGRPSPTKYKYRPAPSIPDNIAAMIGQVNQSNVRPFGRLR